MVGCATSQPQGAAPPATPPAASSGPLVYVGGYRPEIHVFRLNVAAGTLTPAGQMSGGENPSFLAFDPKGRFVFAANETNNGRVTAFSVDRKSGGLTRINDVASGGASPAHLSTDHAGRFLLVANYAHALPGVVEVLPVGPDGKLGAPVDQANLGQGVNPHQIQTSPDNKHVFVPCKGGPFVTQFRFDAETGHLDFNGHARIRDKPKGGPRHLAFHPGGILAYGINELDSTVTAYQLNTQSGRLTEIQTISTLPEGFAGDNSTADIHVHPSGKFVYGSNRGHNSIVIFALDAEGKMTLIGHETRTIKTPRNFHIDPTGTLLLVANQGADTVTVFRVFPDSGLLEQIGVPVPAGKQPSFVGILPGTGG